MDKYDYHPIAVDNKLHSTPTRQFRGVNVNDNQAIDVPMKHFGSRIGFELEENELIIYKNMLGKFLSNGGELKRASVIWDSTTRTYSVILEGVNGNRFLFSTSNLKLETSGRNRGIGSLPFNGRFVLTKKYTQPFEQKVWELDNDGLNRRLHQTQIHTISMNRLRDDWIPPNESTPSTGYLGVRGGNTSHRIYNMSEGLWRHNWSWNMYKKFCTLESASWGDSQFHLTLNGFTIPLIADSSSTNQTMKAYEVRRSIATSEGENVVWDRDILCDGLYLNARLVGHDMVDTNAIASGDVDSIRKLRPIQLDWVASNIRPVMTDKSLWELAGLTNVVEQEKGTLEKWFASRKCKKYYPHGVLRVDFETHLTTSYLSETYDSEVGEVSASIVRKNPEYLLDTGYSSVGLNYHTFKKMVTTNRDFNDNISDLMELKEDARELIGTDGERFLFGFRGDGLECMITLDSMATHYGYSAEVETSTYFESEIFKKWYEFAADYCKRRNMDAPQMDVDTIFKLYINSGEMASEDVDEYNRLK